MKGIKIIEAGLGLVVSAGVGNIIGGAVKIVSEGEKVGTVKKLCTIVGGAVLCSMVADKAVEYTTEKIEEISAIFNKSKVVEKESKES